MQRTTPGHAAQFIPAVDSRNRRLPGLCVRNNRFYAELRIDLTARDDLAARVTAMAIGLVAFFIKPFNDEKFLAAVCDALAQAK